MLVSFLVSQFCINGGEPKTLLLGLLLCANSCMPQMAMDFPLTAPDSGHAGSPSRAELTRGAAPAWG